MNTLRLNQVSTTKSLHNQLIAVSIEQGKAELGTVTQYKHGWRARFIDRTIDKVISRPVIPGPKGPNAIQPRYWKLV